MTPCSSHCVSIRPRRGRCVRLSTQRGGQGTSPPPPSQPILTNPARHASRLHARCARRLDRAILPGRRHNCGKRWSASMATMHRTSSTRYSGGACSCFSLVLGQAQTAVSHNFCVPAPRMPVRESRCPPSRMRREKYGRDLASGQVHGWVRVSCDPHCSRATF